MTTTSACVSPQILALNASSLMIDRIVVPLVSMAVCVFVVICSIPLTSCAFVRHVIQANNANMAQDRSPSLWINSASPIALLDMIVGSRLS
jgi:hypothetical protein